MKFTVTRFKQIDSTNAAMKRDLEKLQTGAVYTAEKQSGGYGRNGRTFYSEPGGLYFSVLLSDREPEYLSCLAGLALQRAVLKETGIVSQIKWLNDLYIENRKAAGILCEKVRNENGSSAVILGIGLNIYQKQFDESIAGSAISLSQAKDLPEDLSDRLLRRILSELEQLLDEDRKEGSEKWTDEYNNLLLWKGQSVLAVCGNRAIEGRLEKISEKGHLLLNKQDETIEISGGEVHLFEKSA